MKTYKRSTLMLLAAFLLVGYASGFLTHSFLDMFTKVQVVSPLPYATPVPDAAPEPVIRIRVVDSRDITQPTFARTLDATVENPILRQYDIAPRETLRFAVWQKAEITTFGLGRVILFSMKPFTLNGHQADSVGLFYTLDYRMVFGEYQTIIIQGENVLIGIIPRVTTVITVR